MDPEFAPAADSANEHFLLDDQVILDFGPFQNQQLYFYEQSADHVLFPEAPEQLTPDDPGPTIGEEFVGVTNAEISSVLGESFGGAMTPADAREVDRILGLVGSPVVDLPELNPNPLPLDEDDESDEVDESDEGDDDSDDGEMDDSTVDPEGSELEIGLSKQGGSLRLQLKRDELIERTSHVVRTSFGDVDAISLFSSDLSERIKLQMRSEPDSLPDVISLFAASGRDRVNLRQKGLGAPDLLAIHGQRGRDHLDASQYNGEIELDGGPGRDVLIGGRSKSELWGGPGSDTFDLSPESSGLQWIMDFDPNSDQIRLDQPGGSYELNVQGQDLWLVRGERTVAVFNDLADQRDALEHLIG